MFAYTYRAYWKDQGATEWNEIQSPSPITWTQENIPGSDATGFSGGQCSGVLYTVTGTWESRNTFNGAPNPTGSTWQPGTWVTTTTALGPTGPIEGIVIVQVTNSTRKNYKLRNGAGDFDIFPPGTGGSTRVFEGSFSSSGSVRWARNVVITSVIRRDGQPDNCGNSPDYSPGTEASCKTTFSTGLIITRPQCIEITATPPECVCCGDLLPKANSILARLG